MIRNKLRAPRNSTAEISVKRRSIYLVSVVIYLLLLGGIINLAPIMPWIKLSVFVVALVITLCFLYAFRATHPSTIDSREDESEEGYDKAINPPPLPDHLPTVSVADDSFDDSFNTRNIELKEKPPWAWTGRRSSARVIRKLEVGDDNRKWLVVLTYTPVSKRLFSKRVWTCKVQELELDDSPYVNVKFATKIPLLPTNDEKKIYCLMRLHWWSHGPAQIGVIAATLAIIIVTAMIGLSDTTNSARMVTFFIIFLLATASAVWYYTIWMQWAYRYLIFTNLKIRLSYRPPFNLPSKTPNTDLALLSGGTNPSSSWWGNTIGYGTIRTETIAHEIDNWLLKEVRFVPHYEQVAALLDQLREDAVKALRSS